jgi:hypothetical protein
MEAAEKANWAWQHFVLTREGKASTYIIISDPAYFYYGFLSRKYFLASSPLAFGN